MANIFQEVEFSRPKGNSFDLSFDVKTTTNMGRLTPVLVKECVPGDIWNIKHEALIRFAPMLAPIMHRVDAFLHTFFVPNRILWNNWEAFITGGLNGANASAVPIIGDHNVGDSSLGAYLGLPNATYNAALGRVSAFPYAVYQRIWWEYYRDQNLGNAVLTPIGISESLVDGLASVNTTTELTTRRTRAWEKDYFTSALPFAQKGSPVLLPMTFSDVPVTYGTNYSNVYQAGALGAPAVGNVQITAAAPQTSLKDSTGAPLVVQPHATAQTSALTAGTTINDFRRAMRLQEWLERNATGGTRYTESLYAHFGVKSSDARLNRPEFIGGFKQPIAISEVLQTSNTSAGNTPQGNMAGHGIGVATSRPRKYFCEEHGFIMTILSVIPKTAYSQGVERLWTRTDKYDFYWPEFATLGEQAVTNQEIYRGGDGLDTQTFGYQSRYSEYKNSFSKIAGAFRTTLSYWHMGRIFGSRPALNASFVDSDPTHRIFAVTDPNVDKLYCHILHRIRARRLMPVFGTPTI